MRRLLLLAVAGCFNPQVTQNLPCAEDGWCPPPQYCMQGICGGGSGQGDDASVVAPNFMFVSSQLFTPSQHVGSFVEAADAFCQAHGQTLSTGRYVAWLSTSTQDAATRLRSLGASGWVRPDGMPFANTVDDILANRIFYPPRIDEQKNDVVPDDSSMYKYAVTEVPPDCNTGVVTIGAPDGDATKAFDVASHNCSSAMRLYCFEVERTATVTPAVDRSKRFMFLTSNLVSIKSPNLTQGIDDLDSACVIEGAVLGTNREFQAFVAPSGASARSRFNTSGPPWIRPDGVLVTTDLLKLHAPISVVPAGDHRASFAWFGAANPDAIGADATTCTDWRSTSGSASQGSTSRSTPEAHANAQTVTCATPAHLYCAER